MSKTEYTLSDFAVGCSGKWQNAIYISCGQCAHPCSIRCQGCLMTAAPTGEPLIISIRQYEQMTGHRIDPAQCAGTISRAAFESAFTRYLLWELAYAGQCPLNKLVEKVKLDSFPITKEDY